jgi:hypothetical protein
MSMKMEAGPIVYWLFSAGSYREGATAWAIDGRNHMVNTRNKSAQSPKQAHHVVVLGAATKTEGLCP